MECMMSEKYDLGESSDAEVGDLIARTLVRESAQTAGLEVALPYGEGLGGRLLVFGEGEESGGPLRGKWVHVGYCGYEDLCDSPLPVLKPGELLALHDVSDAQPEAVFLLTVEKLSRTSVSTVAMREEWRATPERWRSSVFG
jgi:hypothetical protein